MEPQINADERRYLRNFIFFICVHLRLSAVPFSFLCVLCILFYSENARSLVDPATLEKIEPAFAEASSALKGALSKDKKQFSPDKVLDGNWETAWSEAAEGPGVREWIRLVLARPEVVTRVAIIPGWAK